MVVPKVYGFLSLFLWVIAAAAVCELIVVDVVDPVWKTIHVLMTLYLVRVIWFFEGMLLSRYFFCQETSRKVHLIFFFAKCSLWGTPLSPRGENNSLWVDFTLFCVGGWMIGTVGQEANDPREASILLPGSGSLRSHYIITTARRCSVHDCKRTPHTSNFCNCVPIVLMDTKFYIPFTHTRDPVGAPSNVGHANHIYIIEYYVSYRTYLGLV